MLSDEALDEAEDDLRRCLPSWVTEDQIRTLLTNSNGDIAEAAAHFYEHELDLYEQANACNPLVSASQPSLLDNHSALNQDSKPSPHDIDGGAKIRTMPSVGSPKNRVSGVGNRPRKKGRTSLSIESSGCKQSTITKYFGPVLSSVSKDDERSIITAADRHPKEMYKEELDQFLQIIQGALPRNTAATLLEKAKGSIDVAVELYYSDSSYGSVNEKRLSSAEVSMQGGLSSSCGSNVVQVSEETTNLSTLFSQGISSEDTTEGRVSLPIDKYSPVNHACWKTGQPAPYLHLARTFDLVEREKGKIKTTAMLCNMFRSLVALSPEDVLPAVYLCTNKIAPAHENMELNIGGGLVVSALEEACRTSRSRIREMYKTYGDLGDVAQECRRTQSLIVQPRPISIRDFFYALRKISVEIGSGSASRKKNHVVQLMCSCREMEMKFLVRTLVRNLRIGAMMKTILPALAQAVVLNNNSAELNEGSSESLKSQLQCISAEIAEAYNVLPNLDLLIPLLLSEGIHFSASNLTLVPGTPIPPMLARITNGVNQVLKLFEGRAFTCEYKYDGQRAQIHKLKNGSMKVFSRQMKESTSRFPDLMCIIEELCRSEVLTFILDAEIVAVNRKNGIKLLSFQDLSSREKGSKISSITMDSIKVDICIFIFDIMLLNGEQLLALPLRERRKYLKEIFCKEKLGYLQLAKEITVEAEEACLSDQRTVTKMDSFFRDACSSSCEGIMVKSLDVDAGYSASRRTESWLKVKRDYVEGLGDSLDLVPIGAWHGNGRKAGWYSPFLMACYNPDAEEFQSVCRVMSGFSDSFYAEMKEFFSGAKLLLRKPPYYQTDESPDLWFSPELVWEIRGADLTISPVHHAAVGLVHPSRGISMRLPRYIRSNSDRKPEDCSTAADIAYMFKSQTRKMEVKSED